MACSDDVEKIVLKLVLIESTVVRGRFILARTTLSISLWLCQAVLKVKTHWMMHISSLQISLGRGQVCTLALYSWCKSCLSHVCFVQSRKSLWSQPKCILDLQVISSQLTSSGIPCTTPWRTGDDQEFFNIPWRTKGSTKLHGFCDKLLISEFSSTSLPLRSNWIVAKSMM